MTGAERIWVFDWDNTLVDSHVKGLDCMGRALQELGFSVTRRSLEQLFCPDYHAMFQQLQIEPHLWEKLDCMWLRYYQTEATVALFSETLGVLQQLAQQGGRLCLISTGQRQRVRREMVALAVNRFFELVICREDVGMVKPAPDAIQLVQKHYQQAALVYIGDHEADVAMALNAGVDWRRIDRQAQFLKESKIINNLSCLLDMF
jgi:HAD superfamily hydrolase (TIGR01549 family)